MPKLLEVDFFLVESTHGRFLDDDCFFFLDHVVKGIFEPSFHSGIEPLSAAGGGNGLEFLLMDPKLLFLVYGCLLVDTGPPVSFSFPAGTGLFFLVQYKAPTPFFTSLGFSLYVLSWRWLFPSEEWNGNPFFFFLFLKSLFPFLVRDRNVPFAMAFTCPFPEGRRHC